MSSKLILPSQLLDSNRVLLDVAADSKKRVFEEIGLMFENAGGPARSLVTKHLLKREKLGSTIIDTGVAIPHARLEALKRPIAGYLRCLKPINYDGPDALVQHLYILLVPDKADDTHLKILSIMSRMLTDEQFVAAARECPDKAGLLALVEQWERTHLPSNVLGASQATG